MSVSVKNVDGFKRCHVGLFKASVSIKLNIKLL